MLLFHYFRRDNPTTISNPWKTGLGKLVVPNVFVNIHLLKLLVRNYNANKRCIMLPDGTSLVHFAKATIQEVFAVDLEAELPLSFVDLEEEYRKMDSTY